MTLWKEYGGCPYISNRDFISLHEPQFGGNEWSYVKECLDTGWVSSVGKFVDRLEAQLSEYTGVRRADAFKEVKGVSIFKEPDFAKSNYWLNVLLLDESIVEERNNLLELTNSHGILTRPAWTLMHKLPMFNECPRMDLSVVENLERRLINIPSSAVLGDGYV